MNRKSTETRSTETRTRRSTYNANRSCYLSKDGKFYCYEVWDPDGRRNVTQKLEIGKDLSVELTILLDDYDHDWDLQDRRESENADYSFQNQQKRQADDDFEDGFDTPPIENIADPKADIEAQLFPEDKPVDSRVAKAEKFVETELSEDQRNLFYAHMGEKKFLEDIRREEEAASGKKVTKQAVHNRWDRILTKACKHFNVEKPKQEHRKKDEQ